MGMSSAGGAAAVIYADAAGVEAGAETDIQAAVTEMANCGSTAAVARVRTVHSGSSSRSSWCRSFSQHRMQPWVSRCCVIGSVHCLASCVLLKWSGSTTEGLLQEQQRGSLSANGLKQGMRSYGLQK